MNEPKRYSLGDLYLLPSEVKIECFRTDDPAIIQALKDSEDLQTIKDLVSANSVDEIKRWKRSHEAMEKLEMLVLTRGFYMSVSSAMLLPGKRVDTIHVRGIGYEATAPSLISAIEQVKE